MTKLSTLPLSLTFTALPDVPLIEPGDDLVVIILSALQGAGLKLQPGDVLIVTSKIVSKSEGRYVNLRDVVPSERARSLAAETGKDPNIVELVLAESQAISRQARGILVTQHRLGFTSANSGIDQSNIEHGDDRALLLPFDPDTSASQIRAGLLAATGIDVGVIISDSHGRPFRVGNVGVAVGVAGMPALLDLRGSHDLFGRELRVSIQGYADLVASASNLLTGEADEGRPVVLARGLQFADRDGRASQLYRAPEQDLYR